jgi:hypothetical protein
VGPLELPHGQPERRVQVETHPGILECRLAPREVGLQTGVEQVADPDVCLEPGPAQEDLIGRGTVG